MKRMILAVALAACGGKQPAPLEPAPPAPAPSAPDAEPGLDVRMNDYASLMYKYWPAKTTTALMQEACGNVARISELGRAAASAFRSRPNAGMESAGAALQLERSVSDIEQACTGTDLAKFDAAMMSSREVYEKAKELSWSAPHPAPTN